MNIIDESVIMGKKCKIGYFSCIGAGVVLGNNVTIGNNATVYPETVI